jgi:hypothetical protein
LAAFCDIVQLSFDRQRTDLLVSGEIGELDVTGYIFWLLASPAGL